MPACRPPTGKHHTPFDIGGTAKELPIYEIPDPTEPQSNRSYTSRQIRDGIRRDPLTFAVPKQRNDGSEETAMKGHPTLPDSDDFGWVLQVVGEVIEKDIAQPSTDKDSHRGPNHHVVDLF